MIAMSDTAILPAEAIALLLVRTDLPDAALHESRGCNLVQRSGLTPHVAKHKGPIAPDELLAKIAETHAVTVVSASIAAMGSASCVMARQNANVWLTDSNEIYRRGCQGRGWR